MRFAGSYYLVVHLAAQVADDFGDGPFGLTLRVRLGGAARTGPEYAGESEPKGVFEVSAQDREAAPEGGGGGDDLSHEGGRRGRYRHRQRAARGPGSVDGGGAARTREGPRRGPRLRSGSGPRSPRCSRPAREAAAERPPWREVRDGAAAVPRGAADTPGQAGATAGLRAVYEAVGTSARGSGDGASAWAGSGGAYGGRYCGLPGKSGVRACACWGTGHGRGGDGRLRGRQMETAGLRHGGRPGGPGRRRRRAVRDRDAVRAGRRMIRGPHAVRADGVRPRVDGVTSGSGADQSRAAAVGPSGRRPRPRPA